MQKTKVALIGTGKMGSFHARTLHMIPEAELIAVMDTDLSKAENIAAKYNAKAFNNMEDLLNIGIEAVVIATPTSTHLEVGKFFLENKIPCLIEKPLTLKKEDAEELYELSQKNKIPLMVGHIEEFNPAVLKLEEILTKQSYTENPILTVETSRYAYASARITDSDVITDLMIHDIGVVLKLVKSKVKNIKASAPKNKEQDIVSAFLEFENGTIANINTSRKTSANIRKLNMTTDFGYISLDYITQNLNITRMIKEEEKAENYNAALAVDQIGVVVWDKLTIEDTKFIECVQNHDTDSTNAKNALESLDIAFKIQKALNK